MVIDNTEISPDLHELFQEIHDSVEPVTNKTKIKVLIFGPDLSSTEPSAVLRKYIIEKCRQDNFTVVFAEHKEIKQLYELYKRVLGSANDLCKIEYHLATAKTPKENNNIIDGIIIIPDSTGSFIELGMFAIDIKDTHHDKILVLFNNDHASKMDTNFIGLGAKAAFDNGKAKTILLDYNDKAAAWMAVSQFLESVKGNKNWRSLNK